MLSILVGGCSGPTKVILPPLEMVVASGDGQYGTVGSITQLPLQIVEREVETQLPRESMSVEWTVTEGAASFETIATTITDEMGAASVRVRLGSQTGTVVIRARLVEQDRATATFQLFTVNRPVLSGLAPASADPGTSIIVTGTDFSPDAEQNVVLFSGIRGVVTAAAATELSVTVPDCMPQRTVAVTVQLGTVASGPQPLTITSAGSPTPLAVGEFVDATDPGGFACVTVSGAAGARYLTIVASGSSIGAAAYPYELYGVGGAGTPFAQGVNEVGHRRSGPSGAAADGLEGEAGLQWDAQIRFEHEVRTVEGQRAVEWLAERAAGEGHGALPAETAPAAVPALNERRTFQVYQDPGRFAEVTAVARHIGARTAIFVDEAAPAGGYDAADLKVFSDHFDDVIYPEVTGLFGRVSDLDSNERVVILFTPAVNALTDRGDRGFVAGFFFGGDLVPGGLGSNDGEVFYAVVPDPAGTVSDARSKADLLEVVPAILAHEFQHMVGYNERVLVRGGDPRDATWLSEALAQYAEDLVATRYAELGDAASAVLFRSGVRERARRYLNDPASVSLIVSTGQGSLEERGAGFLYIVYLAQRFGEDVVARLTKTTRVGVESVVAETGTLWPDVLSDWWSAVYLDEAISTSGPLSYGDVELRSYLGTPYPLMPMQLGGGDFTRTGSLPSSAAAYYIVTPGASSTTTFRLGGDGGGEGLVQGQIRMRIIRVQ